MGTILAVQIVNAPNWHEQHLRHITQAFEAGNDRRIKESYVQLGDLLEEAFGDDLAAAPLLSLPETVPVVTSLLAGIEGVLLDAGCGPNPAAAMALGGPGRRIVALDIGIGTVRLARARAAAHGVELLGVAGDVEALPFRAGAFSGGVCDDTIEHVPDDGAAIGELARVLAPAGRMALATPNREALSVLVLRARDFFLRRRLDQREYYAARSHLREYTWPEFVRLVQPRLRVRARAAAGWSGDWRRRLAATVTAHPPLRRFSRMIVLAVEPRQP